mgnify:CR=1 FL=1
MADDLDQGYMQTRQTMRDWQNRMLFMAVSYTHLRAHETVLELVCRLLLEKKNTTTNNLQSDHITRSNISSDIQPTAHLTAWCTQTKPHYQH